MDASIPHEGAKRTSTAAIMPDDDRYPLTPTDLHGRISRQHTAAQRALVRSVGGKCGLGLLATVVDDDLEWAWTPRKLGLHTKPHEKCVAGLRELLRRYSGVRLAELAAELH